MCKIKEEPYQSQQQFKFIRRRVSLYDEKFLSCNVSFFLFRQRKLFVYSCNNSTLPLTFASRDICKRTIWNSQLFLQTIVWIFFCICIIKRNISNEKKRKRKEHPRDNRRRKVISEFTDACRILIKFDKALHTGNANHLHFISGVTLEQYHAYCGFTILRFQCK